MKTKRGFQKDFLDILNSKVVIGFFIFIILGLAMAIAGNVIVKEGAMEVENNLNVSNVLFVDSVNSKVGIGTNTPTDNLNVIGRVNITGDLFSNNQNVTQWLFNQSIGRGDFYFTNYSDSFNSNLSKYSFGNLNVTDFQGAFNTNISSFNKTLSWNQSSTNIFPNSLGYKVGIGTKTPDSPLTIVGKINSSGLYINGSTQKGLYECGTNACVGYDSTDFIDMRDAVTYVIIGGSYMLQLNSVSIHPYSDNITSLGIVTRRWKDIYSQNLTLYNQLNVSENLFANKSNVWVNGVLNASSTLWVNGVNASKWLFNQSANLDISKFITNDSNVNLTDLNVTGRFNAQNKLFVNNTEVYIIGSAKIGGSNSLSTGTNSLALGTTTYSSGQGSLSGGLNSRAIGDYSMAFGLGAKSRGISSLALGVAPESNGDSSIAMGESFYVNGSNSIGLSLTTNSNFLNGNNILSIMGGKTGIGTTSPTAKLEVYNLGAGLGETLYGINSSVYATYSNAGIFSASSNSISKAVIGTATGGTTNYGGYFDASYSSAGTTNYGIWATASNGYTNYAGYFVGDVHITGDLYSETESSPWSKAKDYGTTDLELLKKIEIYNKTDLPNEFYRIAGNRTEWNIWEINKLQQGAILELEQENDLLKSELCLKDNSYSWC